MSPLLRNLRGLPILEWCEAPLIWPLFPLWPCLLLPSSLHSSPAGLFDSFWMWAMLLPQGLCTYSPLTLFPHTPWHILVPTSGLHSISTFSVRLSLTILPKISTSRTLATLCLFYFYSRPLVTTNMLYIFLISFLISVFFIRMSVPEVQGFLTVLFTVVFQHLEQCLTYSRHSFIEWINEWWMICHWSLSAMKTGYNLFTENII